MSEQMKLSQNEQSNGTEQLDVGEQGNAIAMYDTL